MTQTFEQWAESEGLDMSVDWKGDLTSPVTAGALRGWEAAQSARQEAVAWRDAIETAVQVLSHIEAGDDVFVGQASEAIAGLTAILHAPTIPPTFEQARDALCDALDAYPPKRDAAPVNGGERALDLLETLFEAYENGPACYEDPSEQAGFVGNAVRLDDETFHACADLLNLHRPRDSERAADAQQVGGDAESLLREARNVVAEQAHTEYYIDLLQRIDAALTSPAKEQK